MIQEAKDPEGRGRPTLYRYAFFVVIAMALIDLRSVLRAVAGAFADCHSLWEVLEKIWVDDITFIGVLFVAVIVMVVFDEHLGKINAIGGRRHRLHLRLSRLIRRSWNFVPVAIICLLASCGVIYALSAMTASPPDTSRVAPPQMKTVLAPKSEPHLITCFRSSTCRNL
jgi:hypothetical protein